VDQAAAVERHPTRTRSGRGRKRVARAAATNTPRGARRPADNCRPRRRCAREHRGPRHHPGWRDRRSTRGSYRTRAARSTRRPAGGTAQQCHPAPTHTSPRTAAAAPRDAMLNRSAVLSADKTGRHSLLTFAGAVRRNNRSRAGRRHVAPPMSPSAPARGRLRIPRHAGAATKWPRIEKEANVHRSGQPPGPRMGRSGSAAPRSIPLSRPAPASPSTVSLATASPVAEQAHLGRTVRTTASTTAATVVRNTPPRAAKASRHPTAGQQRQTGQRRHHQTAEPDAVSAMPIANPRFS